MSCHYSCTSCAGPTYLYLCTSCPTTRQLIGNSCPCVNGYSQMQSASCTLDSQLTSVTSTMITIADVLFAINVGFMWLYVLITFCRVFSPKLRMFTNFAQVVSLTLFYPFQHAQISSRSLRALSSFNFHYLSELVCTQAGPPYQCQFYQNLIGPAFLILGLIIAFIIGFIVSYCCFRKPYIQDDISISVYWKRSRLMFVFHALDISIIYLALSMTRIVVLSFWALLIIVPLLILLIVVMKYSYLILNSPKQHGLEHRTKYSWIYIYDENYSLHYIDYLYEAENPSEQEEQTIRSAFFPHSNFIIFQILFKYLSGTFVVLLYQYKPALMGYVLTFLLLVQLCWFGVFWIYQRADLLFYLFLIAVYMLNISTFWMEYYWLISFITVCTFTLLFFCFFILVFLGLQKPSPKQVMKMFIEESQEQTEQEKNSDQDLILRTLENKTEEEDKKQVWYSKRSSKARENIMERSLNNQQV